LTANWKRSNMVNFSCCVIETTIKTISSGLVDWLKN